MLSWSYKKQNKKL